MKPHLLNRISNRFRHNQQGWTLVEICLVVLLIGIISSIAIPSFISIRRIAQINGDAHDLADLVVLAKLRAAGDFTHSRLYVDVSANKFHIETWNRTTTHWDTEGGVFSLFNGNSFGYGTLASPPAGTQSSIGQPSSCQALGGGSGTIANTACIEFNSRGIPVDSNGTPTGNDAVYITDGAAVYAVTVSATGLFLLWRTDLRAPWWQKR
jgi:Tfp pilus assembly protein FimT